MKRAFRFARDHWMWVLTGAMWAWLVGVGWRDGNTLGVGALLALPAMCWAFYRMSQVSGQLDGWRDANNFRDMFERARLDEEGD